ncbi:hypothetical protein QVD17_17682 [Tagetes erecta]|uniref:Uncharacterized protein n=1 Tax=Tagetes erecta TaxID=13708 RepID=A0AAD8KTH9_TARER|nr:hypothetical protein QVD17_17682 [Tagetes erecta]
MVKIGDDHQVWSYITKRKGNKEMKSSLGIEVGGVIDENNRVEGSLSEGEIDPSETQPNVVDPAVETNPHFET